MFSKSNKLIAFAERRNREGFESAMNDFFHNGKSLGEILFEAEELERKNYKQHAPMVVGVVKALNNIADTYEINYPVCEATQKSDQMTCPCGNVWDMNDEDPPHCKYTRDDNTYERWYATRGSAILSKCRASNI